MNATLPEGLRTGIVPIELQWLGRPVCPPGWVRIVPPRPPTPRIMELTDAIDLLSGTQAYQRVPKLSGEGKWLPKHRLTCSKLLKNKPRTNYRSPLSLARWYEHHTRAYGKKCFTASRNKPPLSVSS